MTNVRRVALITGASRGISVAVARLLASRGNDSGFITGTTAPVNGGLAMDQGAVAPDRRQFVDGAVREHP
jgi:NAD(P)-dependent dehydrogenase (short-subunit alcohol dehydrogenase family)